MITFKLNNENSWGIKRKFNFLFKLLSTSRQLGSFILILLLVYSCKTQLPDHPNYEIYSKILSTFKAKTLIIRKYTTSIGSKYDYKTLAEHIPILELETFNDFKSKTNKADTLDYIFDIRKHVFLLTDNEIDEAFSSPKKYFGNDYIKKYRTIQGTTTFSRVGFNKDTTQALVFEWTQVSTLGGSGYYYLFVRRHNKWKLKYNKLFGIS